MKLKKIIPIVGKKIINIKTLHTYNHNVYINPKCEADWVQVDDVDVDDFIAHQKSQNKKPVETE